MADGNDPTRQQPFKTGNTRESLRDHCPPIYSLPQCPFPIESTLQPYWNMYGGSDEEYAPRALEYVQDLPLLASDPQIQSPYLELLMPNQFQNAMDVAEDIKNNRNRRSSFPFYPMSYPDINLYQIIPSLFASRSQQEYVPLAMENTGESSIPAAATFGTSAVNEFPISQYPSETQNVYQMGGCNVSATSSSDYFHYQMPDQRIPSLSALSLQENSEPSSLRSPTRLLTIPATVTSQTDNSPYLSAPSIQGNYAPSSLRSPTRLSTIPATVTSQTDNSPYLSAPSIQENYAPSSLRSPTRLLAIPATVTSQTVNSPYLYAPSIQENYAPSSLRSPTRLSTIPATVASETENRFSTSQYPSEVPSAFHSYQAEASSNPPPPVLETDQSVPQARKQRPRTPRKSKSVEEPAVTGTRKSNDWPGYSFCNPKPTQPEKVNLEELFKNISNGLPKELIPQLQWLVHLLHQENEGETATETLKLYNAARNLVTGVHKMVSDNKGKRAERSSSRSTRVHLSSEGQFYNQRTANERANLPVRKDNKKCNCIKLYETSRFFANKIAIEKYHADAKSLTFDQAVGTLMKACFTEDALKEMALKKMPLKEMPTCDTNQQKSVKDTRLAIFRDAIGFDIYHNIITKTFDDKSFDEFEKSIDIFLESLQPKSSSSQPKSGSLQPESSSSQPESSSSQPKSSSPSQQSVSDD